MGFCLLWSGVVDVIGLMELLEHLMSSAQPFVRDIFYSILLEHLMGHLLSFVVLVLLLLCVVRVVGVLSLCCGGLKGHFGPR